MPQQIRLSQHTSQVARQGGANPSFCSLKQVGVFVLSPGWDACTLLGYPPALNLLVPIYTPGCIERGTGAERVQQDHMAVTMNEYVCLSRSHG